MMLWAWQANDCNYIKCKWFEDHEFLHSTLRVRRVRVYLLYLINLDSTVSLPLALTNNITLHECYD